MKTKKSNYLKYAIGEIFLVMVGILLALGINNWNEGRKSMLIEKEYIQNLLKDVQSDSTFFHSRKLGLTKSHVNYDTLLKLAENPRESDYIINNNYLFQFYAHQSKVVINHPTAFELVSNKEMTKSLRNYFGTYEYVSTSVNIYNNSIQSHYIPFMIQHSRELDLIDQSNNAGIIEMVNETELHGIVSVLKIYSLNALNQVDSMIAVNQNLLDILTENTQ